MRKTNGFIITFILFLGFIKLALCCTTWRSLVELGTAYIDALPSLVLIGCPYTVFSTRSAVFRSLLARIDTNIFDNFGEVSSIPSAQETC